MKGFILYSFLILIAAACKGGQNDEKIRTKNEQTPISIYNGSASISQGMSVSDVEEIFECTGGRPTNIGIIMSNDGKEWTVPATTNFTKGDFPFASDLYNSCNGSLYANVTEAILQLDGSDIVVIDEEGDLFTAYIFADNYFEMYVDGVAVGKDKVPFTPFNSSIVRFKAIPPFTIAMKLIDWEEALGIGTEKNRGSDYHAGDGGMTAVVKDSKDQIVAVTNDKWKAQTFYTAPVKELACVTESGAHRISNDCDDKDSQDGTGFYGLHWEIPDGWQEEHFDDSDWPNALSYTNDVIGVDNKPAYTNFRNLFDDPDNDAVFIWSSNVVLDNEVIVRYRVK